MTDDEVLNVLREGNEARAAASATFRRAYDGAESEVAKCWASHMVAVVSDDPDEKLQWNMKSLRAAEASTNDERASSLVPTVLANIGFSMLLLARPPQARAWYERARAAAREAEIDDARRASYLAGIDRMLEVIDAGSAAS